ncbi:MAG: ABC transporter substrate-binding protein [Vulcanimicrobiaceae bacterium]
MARAVRSHFIRIAVATLAAVAIAALNSPKIAPAQTKLAPLRVQWYQGLLINQSSVVALNTGIFKKHGLDVTLVPVQSGPATQAAVHAGSVDIGTQDVDQTMINTHLDHLNFVNICGAEGPYYAVTVNATFLKSMTGPMTYPDVMKNFVGKRLGVTALGADTNYFWNALFQGAGLSPDAGHYVATGVGQTSLSAMEHGLVDATMNFEPLTSIEVQHGAKVVVNVSKGEGPELTRGTNPQLIYFASRPWVEAHPDVAKAFNASILEAVKFQKDPKNFPAVLDAMKKSMGDIGEAQGFDQMVRDNIGPSSQTALTIESTKNWLAFTKEFLKFPKDVTVDAIHKEITWSGACK